MGVLDKFIEKYLLCGRCHLPELSMSVQKGKGALKAKCRACPWAGKLDSSHTVGAFICKNPSTENGLDIVVKDEGKKPRRPKQKPKPTDPTGLESEDEQSTELFHCLRV